MDITVRWPLAPAQRLLDLTIRSAHHKGVGRGAGAAARMAEVRKKERYGEAVEPLAIEVGGRMTATGLESLRRLAVDSGCGRLRHAARDGLRPHALRRTLEWEVLVGCAAATLAAIGSAVTCLAPARAPMAAEPGRVRHCGLAQTAPRKATRALLPAC